MSQSRHLLAMLPISLFGHKSALTQTDLSESQSLKHTYINKKSALMQTGFSYSNIVLTRCAEKILLAREQYFPATLAQPLCKRIAHMYDPTRMDSEFPLVREAHNRNDEVIDRIYIGRRFKNDTERLEKLFELYTKMTSQPAIPKKSAKPKG
jgi:hypothetical protein